MSCNKEHFIAQEKVCRETWAKGIFDGNFPDVEYYSYTGGNNKGYVDKRKHHIYCTYDDGIYKTFQKTCECLDLLSKYGVKYDYIFRTNTSTVINVGLLKAYINRGLDDNIVYCGELYSIGIPCPGPQFIYARGNSIILSRKLISIVLDWSKYVKIPDLLFADDNIIGNILNTYHVLRFEPHREYLRSYGFAWHKSLPKESDIVLDNGCSSWTDDDDSYGHLKNFISIQIKSYNNRTEEFDRMRYISSIVNIPKTDYSDEFEFIDKYSANAKYFLNDRKKNISTYLDFNDKKRAQKV